MSKIIIAIDPDVYKSGVAVWNDDLSSIYSLSFFDLQERLLSMSINNNQLIVIVEAGWINKSNWHMTKGMTIASASRIGEKIGANHQVGKMIVELCKYYGIEVIEQKPLSKVWKGRDGKITHEELKRLVPDLKNTTNQEQRDAALLALSYLKKPTSKIGK